MLAFLPSIGFQEMFILLVIGLLLYGRNLPEAGRTLGKAVAHLRRGFQEFKDQLDRDGDLHDVKRSFQDSAKELRKIGDVNRAVADPQRALRELAKEKVASPFADLTHEDLASPLPDRPTDGPAADGDEAAVTSSAKDPS